MTQYQAVPRLRCCSIKSAAYSNCEDSGGVKSTNEIDVYSQRVSASSASTPCFAYILPTTNEKSVNLGLASKSQVAHHNIIEDVLQ